MFKSVPALYRDCLRTVEHMAAKSAKGRAIRAMVRQEFDKNRHVTDEAEIDSLKKKSRTHTQPTASLCAHLRVAPPMHCLTLCLRDRCAEPWVR